MWVQSWMRPTAPRGPLPPMPTPSHVPPDITLLLARLAQGDVAARDAVWEALQAELRRCAGQVARNGGRLAPHATELIQMAYLRVGGATEGVPFESRRHFIAYAMRAMRTALLDHVRSERQGEPLDSFADAIAARVGGDLTGFYEVLEEFRAIDPEMADAAELRAMGYGNEEIAQFLCVPLRTFERRFARARARLHQRMPWMPKPGPA